MCAERCCLMSSTTHSEIPFPVIASNKIFQGDRVVWIVFFLLCMISLVEVYSAASTLSYKSGDFYAPLIKQAIFLTIGTAVCVGVHKIPCRFFKILPLTCWPLCVFLLIFTLLFGNSENGGSRWLPLAPGITLQPSELAKGVVITTVALILGALQREKGADEKAVKYIMVVTGIICMLIVTENLSTAGILFIVVFTMMFIGRVPFRQLGKVMAWMMAAGVAVLMLAYALPKENAIHQKVFHRLETWESRLGQNKETGKEEKTVELTPYEKKKATGKGIKDFDMEEEPQVGHANIAIASSNIVGKMPGNSVERDFLSQAYSDFIYAIIIEEMGLWGGMLVAFLYIILLFRAGRIASRCERNFPAFLTMGLAILLVTQATINMLVAVGLFPVTGQPLPLISRGGTSTIINSAYFGMILSVSRYARKNRLEDAGGLPTLLENDHTPAEEPLTENEAPISTETENGSPEGTDMPETPEATTADETKDPDAPVTIQLM